MKGHITRIVMEGPERNLWHLSWSIWNTLNRVRTETERTAGNIIIKWGIKGNTNAVRSGPTAAGMLTITYRLSVERKTICISDKTIHIVAYWWGNREYKAEERHENKNSTFVSSCKNVAEVDDWDFKCTYIYIYIDYRYSMLIASVYRQKKNIQSINWKFYWKIFKK